MQPLKTSFTDFQFPNPIAINSDSVTITTEDYKKLQIINDMAQQVLAKDAQSEEASQKFMENTSSKVSRLESDLKALENVNKCQVETIRRMKIAASLAIVVAALAFGGMLLIFIF